MSTLPALPKLAETSAQFRAGIVALAARTGWPADEVAAVISLESGFDPTATNSPETGGATGLIQFMPSTARHMGTTTDAIRAMTREAQLELVERFFRGSPKWTRPGDTYLRTFWPAAVGAADGHVIAAAGSVVYKANRGLDANGDGEITAGDVRRKMLARLELVANRPRLDASASEAQAPGPDGGADGGLLLVALVGGWLFRKALSWI